MDHVMIHVCAIVQARVLLALAGGVYLPGSDLGQAAHKLAEPALLFKTWTKVTPHPLYACVQACLLNSARPCPIPWMAPGLRTGLGGPSGPARATARLQVCPPARMYMPVPAAGRLRCSLSVCHPSQVAMCALSGAMETVWVALAQLRAQMQMMRACVCAPCDLPLSSARIAIRQPLMRRVS